MPAIQVWLYLGPYLSYIKIHNRLQNSKWNRLRNRFSLREKVETHKATSNKKVRVGVGFPAVIVPQRSMPHPVSVRLQTYRQSLSPVPLSSYRAGRKASLP